MFQASGSVGLTEGQYFWLFLVGLDHTSSHDLDGTRGGNQQGARTVNNCESLCPLDLDDADVLGQIGERMKLLSSFMIAPVRQASPVFSKRLVRATHVLQQELFVVAMRAFSEPF